MVAHVRELRRKAALCRRAAGIPTDGAANADRVLLALAERLEHDALLREQQLQAAKLGRPHDNEPAAP
jgi:hypothetical protein